jgi:predicted phosphoribosyltransferase
MSDQPDVPEVINEVDMSEPLPPLTDQEVIDYARGIVTGEYMIADPQDRNWSMSLALIFAGMKSFPPNGAIILVPVAPHMAGRWLNGSVPGVTLKAVFLPSESVGALKVKYDEMWAALHPGEPPPA